MFKNSRFLRMWVLVGNLRIVVLKIKIFVLGNKLHVSPALVQFTCFDVFLSRV